MKKKRNFAGTVNLSAGLSALHGKPDSEDTSGRRHPMEKLADIQETLEVRDIELGRIKRDPNQPRKYFSEASLSDLAASIREKGVLQPITIKKLGNGDFGLIAGERRHRASELAGKSTIPSIILDPRHDEGIIRLTENTQREDLLPEEIALGLKDENAKGYSLEALATVIGKKKPAISKYLKIADLVSKDGVSDFLLDLRHQSADDSRPGFEHLYEAACKNSVEESLALLREVVNTKTTVRQIRTGLKKPAAIYAELTAIRSFKKLRKLLTFTFIDGRLDVKDPRAVVKEIELTLQALDEAKRKLEQTRETFL
jgi:ParB/RepB/Spo0J family partition protein